MVHNHASVYIDEGTSEAALDVAVGKNAEIVFDETATTGFTWSLQHLLPEGIDKISDQSIPGTRIGGKGLRAFVFLVKAAGKFPLTFSLARAWEHGKPERTVTVTVSGTN